MSTQHDHVEPPRRYAVARNRPNRIVVPTEHVIVLVGGTVDAMNLWDEQNASKHARTSSRGYSTRGEQAKDPAYWSKGRRDLHDAHDKNWYWQDNDELRSRLEALTKRHPNVHLFTLHGWSGDNSPVNREIAGKYLCDRLCGGDGESAYYAAWRERAVYFHLIGHSHGGNVINELTRRAASSSSWPSKWKIRSITYLSTPFFRRLHQVDTAAFHPDCTVLNVCNQYDLTQRVLADFSLHQLNGVLGLAEAGAILEALDALHFDPSWLEAIAQVELRDVGPGFLDFDPKLLMEPGAARALYEGVVALLRGVDEVLRALLAVVDALERGVVYPLAQQLAQKVCAGRQVLSARVASEFRRELGAVRSGIQPTIGAFEARLERGVFPITGLLADVHSNAFLAPLVQLFSIDAETLDGPFWRLVYALLVEQIDVFDDTSTTPEAQLGATPFASQLIHVDVTAHDAYAMRDEARPYRARFPRFIAELERIERAYDAERSYRALMDLVFTLAAQLAPLRELVRRYELAVPYVLGVIPWAERLHDWLDTPDAKQLTGLVVKLAKTALAYADIIRTRNADMEVPEDRLARIEGHAVGDLNYLMRVSHSVSRQDLYAEVSRVIEPLFWPSLRR